jgi:hypothetical protein
LSESVQVNMSTSLALILFATRNNPTQKQIYAEKTIGGEGGEGKRETLRGEREIEYGEVERNR